MMLDEWMDGWQVEDTLARASAGSSTSHVHRTMAVALDPRQPPPATPATDDATAGPTSHLQPSSDSLVPPSTEPAMAILIPPTEASAPHALHDQPSTCTSSASSAQPSPTPSDPGTAQLPIKAASAGPTDDGTEAGAMAAVGSSSPSYSATGRVQPAYSSPAPVAEPSGPSAEAWQQPVSSSPTGSGSRTADEPWAAGHVAWASMGEAAGGHDVAEGLDFATTVEPEGAGVAVLGLEGGSEEPGGLRSGGSSSGMASPWASEPPVLLQPPDKLDETAAATIPVAVVEAANVVGSLESVAAGDTAVTYAE